MELTEGIFWGLLRLDRLSVTMLGLIALIGVVILRYSGSYLAGDRGRGAFMRWFPLTLACVGVLVTSNHLLLLGAAWAGTSLCLHRLLTIYPDRPAALLAAHKKFLIGRVGDVLLVAGFLLIGWGFGSFRLDEILGAAAGETGQPALVQAAMFLLASAAILKCAQMPFHGWLIQVMEAPTPVSALLHAGVVNIGGFLMIRLAPLLEASPAAQWLLVLAGTASAVIAGLVMMTRISVKVMLAWSTVAQMGFMLMECGLGAYALALLHLVAHSLYKAHAFLGSGRAVADAVRRGSIRAERRAHPLHWAAGLAAAVVAVAGAAWMFGVDPAEDGTVWAIGAILAVAIATAIAEGLAIRESGAWPRLLAFPLAVGALYFGWHHLFAGLYSPVTTTGPHSIRLAGVVGLAFLAQYVFLMLVRLYPQRPFMRELHAAFYNGLYLDEIFTFLTLRIWPQRR